MPDSQSMVFTKAHADSTEVLDVDTGKRTIKAKITTDRVDSDLEVVITSGLNFKRFEKNPVVLFMHDPYVVIAKSLWQQTKSGYVIALTRFAETDFADDIFKLYEGGYMRGWSIGMHWSSIKRRDITPADVRKRTDWAGAQTIIEKADVLEYSAASIPANAEALNRALTKGLFKTARPKIEAIMAPKGVDKQERTVKNSRRVRTLRIVRPVEQVVRPKLLSVGEAADAVDRRLRLLRGLP